MKAIIICSCVLLLVLMVSCDPNVVTGRGFVRPADKRVDPDEYMPVVDDGDLIMVEEKLQLYRHSRDTRLFRQHIRFG